MTIAFRPAAPRDQALVIAAWETSYRKAHTAGMILMDDWADIMREQIAKVLARSYVKTVVAYEDTDPNPDTELLAFAVAEPDYRPPILYYVYTKESYRRSGIARRLLGALDIDPRKPLAFVCSTPIVPRISPSMPMAKWMPLLGRYSRESGMRDNYRYGGR